MKAGTKVVWLGFCMIIFTACGTPGPEWDSSSTMEGWKEHSASLSVGNKPFIPKHLWGIWEGRATHTGGNPTLDHDTKVEILGYTRARAEYTYLLNGSTFVCRSELTLQYAVGDTYFYKDESQTPNCVDGLVRLKKPEANHLRFLWRDSSGSTAFDTAGQLRRP